jgi:hypothetical protein
MFEGDNDFLASHLSARVFKVFHRVDAKPSPTTQEVALRTARRHKDLQRIFKPISG